MYKLAETNEKMDHSENRHFAKINDTFYQKTL